MTLSKYRSDQQQVGPRKGLKSNGFNGNLSLLSDWEASNAQGYIWSNIRQLVGQKTISKKQVLSA
jgi:hypothetical protein